MYCPQCQQEREPDLVECPECGGALAENPAGDAPHPRGPLVQVYRTADSSLLPVIESVLLGEGIDFLVAGEEGQALFPLGSVGGGPDKRFLGAVVRVREDDAERAREALATVAGGSRDDGEE